jgi:major membrane immunogen (membrane-anchored lipoprotein)
MKLIHVVFIVCLTQLLTSCTDTNKALSLENRNGLKYEINSLTPFTGKYITYYNNGQKQTESNFTEGKENGLVTSWYENGQKTLEENYKFGKKTGLRTEWHEKGRKQSEQNFNHDKRDGLTITWDIDGNITGMETYKNGVLAKKSGLKYGLYQ